MSEHEMVQSQSNSGRTVFDGMLLLFVLGAMVVLGLGGAGVL